MAEPNRIKNDEQCIDTMDKVAYDIDYYGYCDALKNTVSGDEIRAEGRAELAEQYYGDKQGTIKGFLDNFGTKEVMEDYDEETKSAVESVRRYGNELALADKIASNPNVKAIMDKWNDDNGIVPPEKCDEIMK